MIFLRRHHSAAWIAGAISFSLVTVGALTLRSSSTTPAPVTAVVERASASEGVSSTGSLAALTERNLGFPRGGQLTSVLVKVGDHVDAGQTLATVDPLPAKQALAAQRAQLRAQEAALDRVNDSRTVRDAKKSVEQAEDILDAVRNQVSAMDAADGAAVANAQSQVTIDESAAAAAKASQDSACGGSSSSSQCTSARAAYLAAQQKVAASRGGLNAAQQKRSVDQAAGQLSIETAEQAVVRAENAASSSRSDRPHSIDQQRALVDAARAAVIHAERDLADTTLRAPIAGVVTSLNGAVGEYVGPSIATSALAPGTDATIPGTSGSSSGGSPSFPLSAAGPSRPGGTQFLVLSDIDQYQVVATFNESDAASIRPDQEVQVGLDAIPDLTIPGRVVSVAPVGTAIAGVISYYVTVALGKNDSRLKGGLTANVRVQTGDKSDVLTIPSSAVRIVNGRQTVTVIEGDQRRTVTIESGEVGGSRTEVMSGLREGQRVVIPGQQGGA